jgi:hypothetical protein
MSTRTPTADGLATAPTALSELSSHRYWGRYAAEAGLPNNGANAMANPAFSRLAVGDVGFVTGLGELYVCTATGTVGGNNATWATLQGGGTATIRSSFVFVVGTGPPPNAALSALSGVASPPMPTNNANLTSPVGDVLSVTCDYLDPSNGTGIEAALLAAAAGGVGVDIRIRPGIFNLTRVGDPPTVSLPLIVPDECRVIGAGIDATIINGGTGGGTTSQQMFLMGDRAVLDSMTLNSPAPSTAPPAIGGTAPLGVISNSPGGINWVVRNCLLTLSTSAFLTRVHSVSIHDQNATARVTDCVFVGGNGWEQPTPSEITAILLGWRGFSVAVTPVEPGYVSNCRLRGYNVLVDVHNCFRPVTVENCWGYECKAPEGAYRYIHEFVGGGGASAGAWRNLYVEVGNIDGAAGHTQRWAYELKSLRGIALDAMDIERISAGFFGGPQTTVQQSVGLWIRSDSGITGGMVRGVDVRGEYAVGVYIQTIGGGTVRAIRMSQIVAWFPVTQAGMIAHGVWFDDPAGTLEWCSVMNSSLTNAPAGGFGIEFTAGTNRCHAVGNVLVPAAGTAILNVGVLNVLANNIIV